MPIATNRWAIVDDGGIIYDGAEEWIREVYQSMLDHGDYWEPWHGDLMLVEIHRVER